MDELDRLLKRFAERDITEAKAMERPPSCLALPRLRALGLDPTRWTDGEWRHVHGEACPRCARLLSRLQAEPLWHPPTGELLAVGFGASEGSAWVQQHLQRDTCRRCLAVTAWARAGRAAATEVRRLLLPRDSMALAPPRPAQCFADQDPEPLRLRFPVGDDEAEGLGTLEAHEGSEVTLTLETRNARFAGQVIAFAVLSADGEVLKQGRFQMSAPGFEGWITGQVRLGFGAFRKSLGTSPTVLFET